MLERRQCAAPGASSSVHHRRFDIVFTVFILNFTCLSLTLFKCQRSHGGLWMWELSIFTIYCLGCILNLSLLPGTSCHTLCHHAFRIMKDCIPTNYELKYTLLHLR